jgi:hypothetical protein
VHRFINHQNMIVPLDVQVFLDGNTGKIIGLKDVYDFNPRPWGQRGIVSEIVTRGTQFLGAANRAKAFTIVYGTYW